MTTMKGTQHTFSEGETPGLHVGDVKLLDPVLLHHRDGETWDGGGGGDGKERKKNFIIALIILA